MRVLIFGGGGLLGHKLWQIFRERFDTRVTVRPDCSEYARCGIFDLDHMLGGVDVFEFSSVMRAFGSVHPDVVVNAIGITKPTPVSWDPIVTLTVNALFPHRLAELCRGAGTRLIHISTDAVFSGRKGMYTESDPPDPDDLYGRSKLLGELTDPPCLTLRTSIVGRDLKTTDGLLEWFLGHHGQRVKGYTHAIYSGFPTLILAQIIADVIEQHPNLSGLYHVSSEPITKHELLCLLNKAYRVDIEIEPSSDVCIDRTLDSRSFRMETGFTPQSWHQMVEAMANDTTNYDEWRLKHDS